MRLRWRGLVSAVEWRGEMARERRGEEASLSPECTTHEYLVIIPSTLNHASCFSSPHTLRAAAKSLGELAEAVRGRLLLGITALF